MSASATTALPIRVPEEMHARIKDRAQEMELSINEWCKRALLHALKHAEAGGDEPQPLRLPRLPWDSLL